MSRQHQKLLILGVEIFCRRDSMTMKKDNE
jgi:hypothetical protein